MSPAQNGLSAAVYHSGSCGAVINRSPYSDAGVDTHAAARLVETIRPLAKSTARPGAMGEIGGFGGLFDPRAAGFSDPILVAATDGVGTKLRIAIDCGTHAGIGVDLVAMCVNDIVVQGAEPLFFLDYFATGRLEPEVAATVIEGIARGCIEAGCTLIGGETAEMPGHYADGEYDLAGFAVGAAERGRLLTGERIREGHRILGLGSSGIHSNGYSLVRRIVADAGLSWDDDAPFADEPLGAALLTPTRLYVSAALAAHRERLVDGFAHITGGGLIENIARILPAGLGAEIDARLWPLPEVFVWLAEAGNLAAPHMAETFNCGIGLVAVAAAEDAEACRRAFEAHGERVYEIGTIVQRTPDLPAVHIVGHETAWRG